MSDKADEKEVWKQYPDYDFIEVSNLGRVRTKDRYVSGKNGSKRLIKGRILRQRPTQDGYMQVHFSVNGKGVSLRVSRMVATCFVTNPNDYPEVNHIDNDRTNNAVSNLEWCTHEYNMAYREKCGVSAKEASKVLRKPVFAVNLETSRILRFESQSEAARQLGVSQSNIAAVVNGHYNQIDGYWFTEDESEITEEKIQEIKDKMVFRGGVIAINIETSEAFLFESQSGASRQLGINVGHMNEVIRGKRNKAGNYWFCYDDENAVEKTRGKFGDDVAKKVEELISQNQNQ